MEVLKAKALAQAAKLKDAGLPPVTVNQIAAQSSTMSSADVTKVIAKLPAELQAVVAKDAVGIRDHAPRGAARERVRLGGRR